MNLNNIGTRVAEIFENQLRWVNRRIDDVFYFITVGEKNQLVNKIFSRKQFAAYNNNVHNSNMTQEIIRELNKYRHTCNSSV